MQFPNLSTRLNIPEDITLPHRRCERLTYRIANVIRRFLLMIIPQVCCGYPTLFSVRIQCTVAQLQIFFQATFAITTFSVWDILDVIFLFRLTIPVINSYCCIRCGVGEKKKLPLFTEVLHNSQRD